MQDIDYIQAQTQGKTRNTRGLGVFKVEMQGVPMFFTQKYKGITFLKGQEKKALTLGISDLELIFYDFGQGNKSGHVVQLQVHIRTTIMDDEQKGLGVALHDQDLIHRDDGSYDL